jgi:sugar phosphate isomerase/epimerase
MEYGVCGEPKIAGILAGTGYDFVELHVQRDLRTMEGEGAFLPRLQEIQATPVPAVVANCFVPGSLKITGPEADMDVLSKYVTTAFGRAERAGIDTIVFGSGGARRIPEGFDRDTAWQQLLDFGRMIAPSAQHHGITIVVEPLNLRECNVFNSVGECADYVRQVDHPNVRLLVDAYHWAVETDSYDDLVESLPLIRHAHIATYRSRMAPGLEQCDFSGFFRALKEGGYDGRLSIEGKWPDLPGHAAKALAELKRYASEAGL